LKDPKTANLGHHLQSLLLHQTIISPSEHAEPAISSDSGRKKEKKKKRM